MVCRIKVESQNNIQPRKVTNEIERTTDTEFTYNKKIWMQSYQIQTKKTKADITQY